MSIFDWVHSNEKCSLDRGSWSSEELTWGRLGLTGAIMTTPTLVTQIYMPHQGDYWFCAPYAKMLHSWDYFNTSHHDSSTPLLLSIPSDVALSEQLLIHNGIHDRYEVDGHVICCMLESIDLFHPGDVSLMFFWWNIYRRAVPGIELRVKVSRVTLTHVLTAFNILNRKISTL